MVAMEIIVMIVVVNAIASDDFSERNSKRDSAKLIENPVRIF